MTSQPIRERPACADAVRATLPHLTENTRKRICRLAEPYESFQNAVVDACVLADNAGCLDEFLRHAEVFAPHPATTVAAYRKDPKTVASDLSAWFHGVINYLARSQVSETQPIIRPLRGRPWTHLPP